MVGETTTKHKPVHNLPSRNHFFTGREDVLTKLSELIKSNKALAINQAIAGLGGMGKTQTAIEFCHRHIADYEAILWVKSENETDINNSYLELANLLELVDSNNANAQALKIDQIVNLVRNWLTANSNWLMVLDNLEDPNLMKHYLPTNHQGHILITTQAHNLGYFAKTINLEKMDSPTGAFFLLKRCGLLQENDSLDKAGQVHINLAKQIVKEMDGLPLALDQAGAYIQNTQSTNLALDRYLRLYKDAKQAVKLRDKRGKFTSDHISVTATFSLAFDKVKKKSSVAANLLKACSFLSADFIPEEIFTKTGESLGDELSILVNDDADWDEVIEVLLGYSLIKRDVNNESLSIHRLVQAVIQDLMDYKSKQNWVKRLIKSLQNLSSGNAQDPQHWPQYQRLFPSIYSILSLSKLNKYASFEFMEAARLFNQVGLYCQTQGFFNESLEIFFILLNIITKLEGESSVCMANTLHNIAWAYDSLGNYPVSLKYLYKALYIKKSILEEDDLSVANTLNSIAGNHTMQGNHVEALELYQEVLSIRRKKLNINHPEVASCLESIASVYNEQGKYAEALTLYKEALSTYETDFDKEHFNPLRGADTLNNIAAVYYNQGDNKKALYFFQEAFDIRERLLSGNHFSIAQSLYNIGEIYRKEGKFKEALENFQQALSINKKVFGNEHHTTAQTLNSIATIYSQQNKNEAALEYYHQALSIYKQTFPSTHLDIAGTLMNIATTYDEQKNYQQAELLYLEALNIFRLGKHHLYTGQVLHNLGHLYQVSNKELEAVNCFTEALTIYDELFAKHPEYIRNLLSLYSDLLLKLNRNNEAQPLLDRITLLNLSD